MAFTHPVLGTPVFLLITLNFFREGHYGKATKSCFRIQRPSKV